MVNGKRGASHFEMVISFVFFLGFVFFLFLFLKPYDTTVLSGSAVAALYDTFEEEVHTNLTSLFLKAENDDPKTCFRVQLIDDIFVYALTESRVTNLADTLRDSNLDDTALGGDLNVNADDGYYRVAISPEFDNGTLESCDLLEDYVQGSKLERRVISYSALEKMEEKYTVDYENLKADLRVPAAFEFFIVSEDMPEIQMKNFIPDSVRVDSHDYVLEVLRNNGTVINTRFTLGIW